MLNMLGALIRAYYYKRHSINRGVWPDVVYNPETRKVQTIVYSPYFVFEHLLADDSLIVRVFITIGGERVPPYAQLTGQYTNGNLILVHYHLLPFALEVYFINRGFEHTLEVDSISVNYEGRGFQNLLPEQLHIPARSKNSDNQGQKITAGLLGNDHIYHHERHIELQFSYAGKLHQVEGMARRIPSFNSGYIADDIYNLSPSSMFYRKLG